MKQRTRRKSYLGLCNSLKPAARWWDSQGLRSLYIRASSSAEATCMFSKQAGYADWWGL